MLAILTTPVRDYRLTQLNRRAYLIALLLIAANLRPSITGVGPLLKTIQDELALSATAAGLLGSLPVLIFAAFAPLARLARRIGGERMLLAGLFALVIGLLVRSEGHVATLFAGTVILSIGLASTNVLLPVLIKQHYPERVPALTTAYATIMGFVAALASGIAVPLAQGLPGGWQSSLASWALLAIVGIVFWLPNARAPKKKAEPPTSAAIHPPWRSFVGWQVTAFMGLQSTVFYVAISWFPAILRDHGFSASAAGWLLTLYQAAALLAGLAVPTLIRRFRDQRGLAFCASILGGLSVLGILIAPEHALFWMTLLGCASGPSLILALSFMGLRARTQESAAALSLMAQGIGYLVAAFGPVVFGLVHDHTGGWQIGLMGVIAVTVAQGLSGLGAGRGVKV
jgi:CP family cyanate transporter-like MFS transporter